MKICYIFGAAEGLPETFQRCEGDLVIAADAGIRHLEKFNLEPDIALGDFDSLGYIPECREVIKHPVMKNDTDTLLAVKTALARGYKNIVLYGCSGKRPDHTLANYQVLAFISSQGGRGFLCEKDFVTTAITNGQILFNEKAKGTLSVFSAVTKSSGVNLKGLLYPLENAEISFDFPIGVSNEFIGERSCVQVESGTLIVIWNGKLNDIIL